MQKCQERPTNRLKSVKRDLQTDLLHKKRDPLRDLSGVYQGDLLNDLQRDLRLRKRDLAKETC